MSQLDDAGGRLWRVAESTGGTQVRFVLDVHDRSGGRCRTKRIDERQATGETIVRLLGERPGHDRPIRLRQHRQIGRVGQVLQGNLADVFPRKRPLAGQQLDVDDGQAVLIAVPRNPALEGFRGCVDRRHAAHDARTNSTAPDSSPARNRRPSTRSETRNRFRGFTSRCWRLCFSIMKSRPSAASAR